MNQAHDPGTRRLAGPRRPEYVIEIWVSDQLRERLRRNNAALAHDHQAARRRAGRIAEPQAELEAEP